MVTLQDLIDIAARTAHEVNRAYCSGIGDDSQLSWDEAPEWQRISARSGVEAILDNPESTPRDSHNSWLAEKRRDGWTYGEVKDPDSKAHPCFLPYEDLPADQKAKDELFVSSVRGVLHRCHSDTLRPLPVGPEPMNEVFRNSLRTLQSEDSRKAVLNAWGWYRAKKADGAPGDG